jgi:hypothetical protein
MRLGLHGQVRRVWGVRGVKVVQPQQTEYRWLWLALAVDPRAGRVRWTWLPNVKSVLIADVVANWKAQGFEALVWDGAPGHTAERTRRVGVPLVRLPPYSPELNPAERVFEELRRELEGEVYTTLVDKRRRADAWLERLAAEPERVRRLCGWAWVRRALEGAEPPPNLAPS